MKKVFVDTAAWLALINIDDDFDLEIAQTRKNEKLMQYLESCSQEEAVFSLDDVRHKLGLD